MYRQLVVIWVIISQTNETDLPQALDEDVCDLLAQLYLGIHMSESRYEMLHKELCIGEWEGVEEGKGRGLKEDEE